MSDSIAKSFSNIKRASSFCWQCKKRNNCEIQEDVAMEEVMARPRYTEHLDVTVKCNCLVIDKDAKHPLSWFMQ